MEPGNSCSDNAVTTPGDLNYSPIWRPSYNNKMRSEQYVPIYVYLVHIVKI